MWIWGNSWLYIPVGRSSLSESPATNNRIFICLKERNSFLIIIQGFNEVSESSGNCYFFRIIFKHFPDSLLGGTFTIRRFQRSQSIRCGNCESLRVSKSFLLWQRCEEEKSSTFRDRPQLFGNQFVMLKKRICTSYFLFLGKILKVSFRNLKSEYLFKILSRWKPDSKLLSYGWLWSWLELYLA